MSIRARKARSRGELPRWKRFIINHLPSSLLVLVVIVIMLPYILPPALSVTWGVVQQLPGAAVNVVEWVADGIGGLFNGGSSIAPLFTAEVDYWSEDIARWSEQYTLDPNLLATVMQIESCGHPTVSSSAGAQGLFQVMPFHFDLTENQLDPDTNAMRGANFLNYCYDAANGDVGLAMACYNGGPSVINRNFNTWAAETQRYYTWGTGIYADAVANSGSSETLDRWLNAGGARLCQMAATELGIN